jgi:aminomethyltransferase
MPIPTPFHSCTAPLCESHQWRDWSGYLAAALYEPVHEREYYAIRNGAALIDVSPLFKYAVSGPDAVPLLNRIMTRDISKCAIGQVMYSPWCDDDGYLIDDGTIARLAQDRFRITAAEPNLAWFLDCAFGLDVSVTDISEDLAVLALQGPNARKVLHEVLIEIDPGKNQDRGGLDQLRYYRFARARVLDFPLEITRTGYTGDLGYELWVSPEHAGSLWDQLMNKGLGYGVTPAGMVALDIARIEAGLPLIAVDYISTRRASIPEQKSSPYELGLRWAVDLSKGSFVGRRALQEQLTRGLKWAFVGVEVQWESLETLFGKVGLVPQLAGRASRTALPVYAGGRQIGQATSHTFSPLLKKYIALVSVKQRYAKIGQRVQIEITVEYTRQLADATVVRLPFFDPPRKKA